MTAHPPIHGLFVAGALLGFVLGSAPARAQLVVEPSGLTVTVPQGETTTQTVTLTNAGDEALAFCLSFERPLQRTAGAARLSAEALGSACGEYGEVLALVDEGAIEELSWNPYGLAMTPEGRLFAAEQGARQKTYELTPSLEVVRAFDHPVVEELTNRASTPGVTYRADTGTLWWLNRERRVANNQIYTERALLLEGDLDGVETGRRVEIPIAEESNLPINGNGDPVGLSYDPARKWYYFTDISNATIWAVDTLGNTVRGYPVQMEGYPGATIARGINVVPAAALDGAEAGTEGLRLELYINPPGPTPLRHIGVVGRYGEDTAPGAEPLETPLLEPLPGTDDGDISGEALRSVLDPNGVLYYPWAEFQNAGIVAVRPLPLPPSWLVVEAWDGTLAPGASREVVLTFRAGARAVGDYTSALQAFDAASGEAVEVPLTLTVTQRVDAEDEGARPDVRSLAAYPNPSSGAATVALMLDEPQTVRVVVYDVLGRNVAVLHEGLLAAGAHRFTFDGTEHPAGTYVVRATGSRFSVTRPVTILR